MKQNPLGLMIEGATVAHGTVVRAAHGDLLVRIDGGDQVNCDLLRGALSGRGPLCPGDRVLLVLPSDDASRGCVLGAVLPYEPDADRREISTDRHRIAAREIVVEAGERLELRVGDSTILITEDGKIVIQGKNVLSRARALNKIRGAAVQIN